MHNEPLSDFSGEHGPNRFHQNRTVPWLMSIPRSASKSSTLRSDSGYLTYIITTRRMTSGELLKYLPETAAIAPILLHHATGHDPAAAIGCRGGPLSLFDVDRPEFTLET